MTDMKEIYDKDPEFRRIWHEIQDMKERMLWCGCVTKEQCEAGWKIMMDGHHLWKELYEVLKKYE